MTVWRLIIREILHRKLNFALGLVSTLAAVACLAGALILLKAHAQSTAEILARAEAQTKARLAALKDDVRKTMLTLGFNVVILPKDQPLGDWYADDYASKYMPEEYVNKLAAAKIVTVRHLLPSLQQKMRWPEQKRTIILIGTRGEVPLLHRQPKKPMVQPVPAGSIVIGYELHRSLGLKLGDHVRLLGRDFVIHKCHPERGSKDDITVWINLAEAQQLLGKPNKINAILALECKCAWADLSKVRAEIGRVLPGTQVIEVAGKALARAETRRRVAEAAVAALEHEKATRAELHAARERLASILVPLVIIVCVVWIGLLALDNVRRRRREIGILRALGYRSVQILRLFLGKAFLMGVLGSGLGVVTGLLAGHYLTASLEDAPTTAVPFIFSLTIIAAALVLGPFLTIAASWLPALLAAQQDPAEILREE